MARETNMNNNVRRCGQIGDGEDDELSMVDVLNEQTRLQADADAVLGGSDAKNCAYPQGYIKRQALYACATCTPEGNAGICLACSFACHEGHDLYELYTKRYFTCDCGNEKFGGKECKLYKGTKSLNAKNRYNHNFKGVYCSCRRPYPDPEDMIEDEMIQCIMCEDWYHGRHLKAVVPDSDDFHEMTCPSCMSKYAFLWAYNIPRPVLLGKHTDGPDEDAVDEKIDVCDTSLEENPGLASWSAEANGTQSAEYCPKDELSCTETRGTLDHTNQLQDSLSVSPDANRKRASDEIGPEDEAPSIKKVRRDEQQQEHTDVETKVENDSNSKTECILKSLQKRVIDYQDCAAFWPEGWRSKLCQCEDCLQLYKDRDIEFLIDESDTVHAYEEKGRDSADNMSEEESTASALAGMDRVQQIEVLRGYMDLRTELNEFLHGFAQSGKVVTEADIQEFFQRMNQRRKENMNVSQFTCR